MHKKSSRERGRLSPPLQEEEQHLNKDADDDNDNDVTHLMLNGLLNDLDRPNLGDSRLLVGVLLRLLPACLAQDSLLLPHDCPDVFLLEQKTGEVGGRGRQPPARDQSRRLKTTAKT